nr:MAG TPA: hypothetical protein [Caudoviricetes sp.]
MNAAFPHDTLQLMQKQLKRTSHIKLNIKGILWKRFLLILL